MKFAWSQNYLSEITWLMTKENRRVVLRLGENVTKFDFVLIRKEQLLFFMKS